MRFTILKKGETAIRIARKLGYEFRGTTDRGEHEMMRSMSGNLYPRFHAYVTEDATHFIFNLHLDQKKPSYGGTHAHAGEYEGELVEIEIKRIQEILR